MSSMSNTISLNEYPIEIKQKNDSFFVFCTTFRIIEEGSSIDKAYKKLAETRAKIIQQYESLGIPMPAKPEITNRLKKIAVIALLSFVILLPIITISGYIFITRKASSIIANVEHNVSSKLKAIVNDPKFITDNLNKFVVSLDKVTPERKAELQIMVRKIGLFVQPMVAEINDIDFKKK